MKYATYISAAITVLLCRVCASDAATEVDYVMGVCPIIRPGTATCPDNKYITLYLHTRLNPISGQILDLETNNLNLSNFNAANPVKILIHGQNGSASLSQLIDLRKEYLTKGEYNLITVDWHTLSPGPFLCYPTNVKNMRHVSECIAQLVRALRQIGVLDIHAIGHSLGAHAAGNTANYLTPDVLPRITGLDPAKPLFDFVCLNERLDPSDAVFVDIVHTNMLVMGGENPSGHVDFYLNGGTNQPSCGGLLDSLCSHYRSYVYFTESINSAKGFYGWPCSNFLFYSWGFCFDKPRAILMGDQCNTSARGIVSLRTASTAPFALGQS